MIKNKYIRKTTTLLCCLCLLTVNVQAQDYATVTTPRFRLGLEAGMSVLWGAPGDIDRIRESRSYYYDYDDYGSKLGIAHMDIFHIGLKLEYMLNARFAVSAGARFSENNIRLKSDNDYVLFNRDYFLWKVSEEGLNTDYVSIQNILQTNYYVGIPLEIKFFPRKKDYFVRHFFTLGTALNFLVNSSNDVEFQYPRMGKYLSVIQKQIGEPAIFQGLFYAGFGLKIGSTRHAFGEIEFQFPICSFADNKVNSLIQASTGFGIRAAFYLPVLTKHLLTYDIKN